MFKVGVEVWTKNFLYRFINGHIHFGMPCKRCQNEYGTQSTDVQCASFKPQHRLQACTANLMNMERFKCTTTTPIELNDDSHILHWILKFSLETLHPYLCPHHTMPNDMALKQIIWFLMAMGSWIAKHDHNKPWSTFITTFGHMCEPTLSGASKGTLSWDKFLLTMPMCSNYILHQLLKFFH